MICKKCNKEIEYTASVCPHCGEKCVESDEFFHEMLSHVMDENTQSSEELAKLKDTMKKRKQHRRRNRIIAALLLAHFLYLYITVSFPFCCCSVSSTGSFLNS